MSATGTTRATIGFLIDHTDSQYQFGILQGIADYAEHQDVNLICFEGGIIQSTRHFDYERNIVYDLATNKRLDGLIVLSDSIAHLLDDDTLLKFCRSYEPLPVIFVGRSHPEVPSIVIDSSKGMRELVNHLVEVHGYRSFAFIKGLSGSYHADVRYGTFVDTLREHGIEMDEELIFEGDYMGPSGWRSVQKMLDTYHKRPDVLVSCNDEMAISALGELRRRGIETPKDIAVVGFDDILKCGTTNPPLTTVRQPLIREGWTAMETMMRILDGETPPMRTELETGLVVRQSCGCAAIEEDITVRKLRTVPRSAPDTAHAFDQRVQSAAKIQSVLESVSYDFLWCSEKELTKAFISSFYDALFEQDSHKFLRLWRDFLDTNLHLEFDEILIKDILEALYTIPLQLPHNDLTPETLFYAALSILQEKALHQIRRSYNQTLKESWILNYRRDELDICLNREQIVNILYGNLKALGIASSYLTVYESVDEVGMPSRLVLAFADDTRHPLPSEGLAYPAQDLIPKGYFNDQDRFSFIVESLHYANQQIGFLILDMSHHINSVYGGLRRIVSSIFRGIDLVTKIEDQRTELIVSLNKLRTTMAGIIKTLSITVETKDPYTAGHQRRVSDLSRAIAQKMNLEKDLVDAIRVAASVHDIGKIFTPSEILNKPGALMEIEFDLIKHHAEAGYNILKNIEFPWPIADIVLQHHERCDGSGYPGALKKDDIMLEARIICVADVVEALMSIRPYRGALGLKFALGEIKRYRGIKYDEKAVDACLSLFADDGYTMPSLPGPPSY